MADVRARIRASARPRDAVLPALIGGVTFAEAAAQGFAAPQNVDLVAAGESVLVEVKLQGKDGGPPRVEYVRLNRGALDRIEHALRRMGVHPEAFAWSGDGSPYPGLRAFQVDEPAIFFGREARVADAIGRLDAMRRDGPPLLTILAASGAGKSSFSPWASSSGCSFGRCLEAHPWTGGRESLPALLARAVSAGTEARHHRTGPPSAPSAPPRPLREPSRKPRPYEAFV